MGGGVVVDTEPRLSPTSAAPLSDRPGVVSSLAGGRVGDFCFNRWSLRSGLDASVRADRAAAPCGQSDDSRAGSQRERSRSSPLRRCVVRFTDLFRGFNLPSLSPGQRRRAVAAEVAWLRGILLDREPRVEPRTLCGLRLGGGRDSSIAWGGRDSGRNGRFNPQVPALRHRPGSQPDTSLCGPHRVPGRRVFRGGGFAASTSWRACRHLAACRRSHNSGSGRAVRPRSRSYSGRH